jgi:Xaa-Pro aminopeptidase
MTVCALLLAAVPLAISPEGARAQDIPLYQSDFPASEFQARRQKVLDAIGKNAIAIVQGAPSVRGFEVFRQSNEFYYLTGLEVPHSYLLIDGRSGKTTLYLPHRDAERERNEGKQLSAEDADEVKTLTAVDAVYGSDLMARHFRFLLIRAPFPALYTPFAPAEGRVESRDEVLGGLAGLASDPWDGRGSREGQFLQLLRTRFPQFELEDLSPTLDDLRLIKSPREIALLRRAAQLAGQGLVEAMRSTRPGILEYQLDAAARYIFYVNGARGEAYSSITAGGQNAWYGHYFHNKSRLQDGQMVLMDFAPDYRYYTSDVGRVWPVNGRYTDDQRKLGTFILGIHKALLRRIKPGVTVDQILDDAAPELQQILEKTAFTNPNHRRAAEAAVKWRGHLSHPVGMTVHDVGNYKNRPLQPGMVFAPDPMLWVPEEKLYVRIEDTVAVTESGVDNLSGPFVPSELDEIAALVVKGDGIVQKRPALPPLP